jgi:hypothetical protein
MTPSDSDLRSKSSDGISPQTWACFGVCVAGLVTILAMDLITRKPLWKDEAWYLSSVPELLRLGFSPEFLRSLPGPAGPLFAVVHSLFKPLTSLDQPGVRLVTIALSVLTFLALGEAMKRRGVAHAWLKAPALMAAPMMFGPIGTAITEIPAALFFCSGLALLLEALNREARTARGDVPLAILAGVCLAIAISGRQQYLIAALGAVLLLRPGFWRVGVIYAVVALGLAAPLFLIWGGISPPKTAYVGSGLSVAHGLLSFSYAGFVYCLYDAGWLRKNLAINIALVMLTITLNVAFGFLNHLPFQQLAVRYLPPVIRQYYGLVGCGAMLGFGAMFLALLARVAWQGRHDRALLYLCVIAVLMLGAPAKITHMFSGRYIASALPILVMLAAERAPDTYFKAGRLALGCLLGAFSLAAILYQV